jgi:hypothetical protein
MVCREVIDPAEGDTCFCTHPVCDGETDKVQTTYEWSHPEYRKPGSDIKQNRRLKTPSGTPPVQKGGANVQHKDCAHTGYAALTN